MQRRAAVCRGGLAVIAWIRKRYMDTPLPGAIYPGGAGLTSSLLFCFSLGFVNFYIAFVASNIFGYIAIMLVIIQVYSVCM
jgi:hypothetical protein